MRKKITTRITIVIGVVSIISFFVFRYKIRAKKADYHKMTVADIAWG